MNFIGTNEDVDRSCRAVLEHHVDAIAAIGEPNQPMREMHSVLRQSASEHREQIGPMNLVVRKAERLNHRIPKRCPQQGSTVIPTALMKRDWTNPHAGKLPRQTETVQHPRCVRAHLNPGPNVAKRSARSYTCASKPACSKERTQARPPIPPPITATEISLRPLIDKSKV